MILRQACFVGVVLFAGGASAQTYYQGYMRPNGTYVQPHFQTAPNNSRLDNWSTRPNVNPYTGQMGTVNPYPAYNPPRPPPSAFGNPYRTPPSGYGFR